MILSKIDKLKLKKEYYLLYMICNQIRLSIYRLEKEEWREFVEYFTSNVAFFEKLVFTLKKKYELNIRSKNIDLDKFKSHHWFVYFLFSSFPKLSKNELEVICGFILRFNVLIRSNTANSDEIVKLGLGFSKICNVLEQRLKFKEVEYYSNIVHFNQSDFLKCKRFDELVPDLDSFL